MSFYVATYNFVKPAVILMDDAPKTMSFGGKTVVLLVVGEQDVREKPHICGFVSNEAALPSAALGVIKKNYENLLQMDVDLRLKWIKGLINSPTIKIQKDKIVDRTMGDGPEPIHMYNRSPPLWR